MVYLPAVVAVNKMDMPHDEKLVKSMNAFGKVIKVSATKKTGIDELKENIYESLDLIRVYMRDRAGNTDFERPLVLKDGATVKEVCRKISREMMDSFRYAMLTSHSSKINEKTKDFAGMQVPITLVVTDAAKKLYEIKVGIPPTSALLKKELGIETASGKRKEVVAGDACGWKRQIRSLYH